VKDFIPYTRKQVIQELTAEELSQNTGTDVGNIESKSGAVAQSIGIVQWNQKNNILVLRSRSISRNSLDHRVRIMFDLMPELRKTVSSGKFNTSDPVLIRDSLQKVIRGDIKVHCECESYQFYRSYQLTQLDAAIIPEPRPPKKTDPNLERSHLCHHLAAGLRYLMKYEQHIIEYIMKQDPQFAPTEEGGETDIEVSIAKQLGNLVDTWTKSMGDALNDPGITDKLSRGIKEILRSRRLRVERLIIKEADIKKLRTNVDEFIVYITDNFVPKEDRQLVKTQLEEFIQSIIGEQEPEEQGEEPMTELSKLLGNDRLDLLRGIIRKNLQEVLADESPDDVNGADPSAMNAGENILVPAIKEYCNQTGKKMYEKDFQELILGIVRAIDSTDKLYQFKKMVGGFANPEAVTRFEEPEEQETGSDEFNFGDEAEEMGVNDQDIEAIEDLESGEEKMEDKKEELEL